MNEDYWVIDASEHVAWGPFNDADDAEAFIESDKYLISWCIATPIQPRKFYSVYPPSEYWGEWPKQ